MILAYTMALVRIPAAYIDPNTGGLIFQVLVVLFGVASGLLLFFSGRIKKAFFRLRRMLGGSKSSETEVSPQEKE